jgi:hypothetical protein
MPEERRFAPAEQGQTCAHPADRAIARLADRQHGVVARAQLLASGVTPAMIETRLVGARLIRLHRGVYAVGHRQLRREGFWLAAVLACGPYAVLSHRDAAALHAIRLTDRTRTDVTVPGRGRHGPPSVDLHRVTSLDARDVTAVNGIPVTTVARTLVDLGEVVPQQALAKALSEAERQGKLDVTGIEAALGRTRGRHGPGTAAIKAALREHAAHGATLTRSELEDRFVALLDAHDLPRPATNAYVEGIEGDAVWPDARLVVELDGWDAHKTRRAFQRDREKGNALLAAGWTVMRFTYRDVVDRPGYVATSIAAQLSRACESARPPRAGGRRA